MFSKKNLFALFLAGVAGGALSSFLRGVPAHALDWENSVTAQEFQLVDTAGNVGARLVHSLEGSPALFMFDKKGNCRTQMGVHAGGLPFLSLQDDKQAFRGLFRLDGPNQAPLWIFKENDSAPRLIVGLDMSGIEHNGFVSHFERGGNQADLTGSFRR